MLRALRGDRGLTYAATPPEGTRICLGMDGSETGDWTAIKAETVDGLLFTPRRPGSGKPTIWNPADHGGRMPRAAGSCSASATASRSSANPVSYRVS